MYIDTQMSGQERGAQIHVREKWVYSLSLSGKPILVLQTPRPSGIKTYDKKKFDI